GLTAPPCAEADGTTIAAIAAASAIRVTLDVITCFISLSFGSTCVRPQDGGEGAMLPDLSAAPAGGQALGELALEAFARDVVTRVEVPGDLARGLPRLQVDDVDVPKHAFAVGSLVAIAFFERTRWC